MRRKGQMDFPIVTLVVISFGLLIIAPFMLKIFNTMDDSMTPALANVSGQAAENFNVVMNTAVTFWDKVVILFFFLALVMMVISSFLIDTHPFWIILYIFVAFMLMLFAPDIIGSLDQIYDSPTFATELNQLTFMNSLRIHFGEFLLGFIILTGIIMYGKVKFFSGGAGGERR